MASSKASTNRLRRPRQLVPGMCGLAVLVVAPPALDDDLGLAESVEDFAPIGERDGVIRRERLEPNLDPMRAIRKRSPGWRCPF